LYLQIFNQQLMKEVIDTHHTFFFK